MWVPSSNDHDEIDLSGMGSFFRRNRRTKPRRSKMRRRAKQGRRRRHYKKHHDNFHNVDFSTVNRPRDHYNDLLVNMLSPRDISGLSAHTALRAALHAPERFRESMGKSDMFPIIWDSGASACVTFDKEDFLSFNNKTNHKPMKSISGSHVVCGEGYVLWSIPDETGVLRNLKLKPFYIPDCSVRILSTEGLLQSHKRE